MNKFLVIQTASIGDVILATPILEKLNHYFNNANIDFLLKKGNESLFNSHPYLHKVLIWDKSNQKYKNYWKLINYIRDNNYDCVINVQRFASSGFITIYSGASLKIGFRKNPFSVFFNKRIKHTIHKGDKHEIERNLDLVRSITNEASFPVKLYPSQHDDAKMSQYKTVKYICISPASLWFTKQYPKEKWVKFVKNVDNDMRIYFLGSRSDYYICDEIIQNSNHTNSLNLAGKLSFLESATLMKDAKMNYMNDSAPLHLASSVNAPVTAIFCSTIPSFGFGPLSDDSVVVQSDEILKCKPCGIHGLKKCPKEHFKCALSIDEKYLLSRL